MQLYKSKLPLANIQLFLKLLALEVILKLKKNSTSNSPNGIILYLLKSLR